MKNNTPQFPRSLDQIQSWLQYHLDRNKPADICPEKYREAANKEAEACINILRQFSCINEEGINSLVLLNILDSLHFKRDISKNLIAEWCNHPAVLKSWESWQNTGDREEVRFRLELLRESNFLTAGLIDFIAFFFRSSDPLIYQTAALTAGKLIDRSPELKESISDYFAFADYDLISKIPFNNKRHHRRMIMVQSAIFAQKSYDEGSPFFRDIAGLIINSPETLSVADLNVALYAINQGIHLLYLDADQKQMLRKLLTVVADKPLLSRDRITVRHWGMLFCNLSMQDDKEYMWNDWACFSKNIEAYLSVETEDQDTVYRALLQWDEVFRCIAFLPENTRDYILEQREKHKRNKILPETLRIHTWLRRELGVANIEWKEKFGSIFNTGYDQESVLDKALAFEYASSFQKSPLYYASGTGEKRKIFIRLLAPLSSEQNWLALEMFERCLHAFFLLDISRYIKLSHDEVYALLQANNITEGLEPTEKTSFANPGDGRAKALTANILLRLITLETKTADTFLDGRVLHQISIPETLIAFISTGNTEEANALLADVFEHLMRVNLISTSGFSAENFLYKLAIRKPGTDFFIQLLQLCYNREYRDINNAIVPVQNILETLLAEQNAVHDPEHFLVDANHVKHDKISTFRRKLSEISTFNSLNEQITAIAHLLFPAIGDIAEYTAEDGIYDIIISRNNSPNLLQSGIVAYADISAEKLKTILKEKAIVLKHDLPGIFPQSLYETTSVNENIHNLSINLDYLNKTLFPLLPAFEAELFNSVINKTKEQLLGWQRAFNHLGDNREEIAENPDDAVVRRKFLEEILEIPHPEFKVQVLSIFIQSIQYSFRNTDTNKADIHPDQWVRTFNYLRWAGDPEISALFSVNDRPVWISKHVDIWNFLANEVMQQGHEARAEILLDDEHLKDIRTHNKAAETLNQMRYWFFDLYHPAYALKAHRDQVSEKNNMLLSIIPELGAFAAHYWNMWVALTIGAILMLDFGDAFMAMAEVGDVFGVTATFLLGVFGALIYLIFNLSQKVKDAPEDKSFINKLKRFNRVSAFLLSCLLYTFAITTLLWFLLSGTDEVVHGSGAFLHIIVWSGFALFIGVFFSLVARRN